MDKKKWLWKRRSSDRSPGETENSGSISSNSGRLSDEPDLAKESPSVIDQSPDVMPVCNEKDAELNDTIKSLAEKLSAALVNVSAKDDLVKQHSKVAEEAVAGWEKAENEVTGLKKQLANSVKQKLALEERVSHLDGALKECVRQLRLAREEQEEKIHEAVSKTAKDFDFTKLELESQLHEAKMTVEKLSESHAKIDPDFLHKLEYLEEENQSLRYELLSHSEELEIRTIERDLSSQAAETASKQHLDSIKKVSKLETECRKLKFMIGKLASHNDHKTSSVSSLYVDSFTDSQSDCGDGLNAADLDISKLIVSDSSKATQGFADSWVEHGQIKGEHFGNINSASAVEIDFMDDFIEMEKLVALPEVVNDACEGEPRVSGKEFSELESSLRNEIDILVHRASKLEERLQILEAEKFELEEQLVQAESDKADLESSLMATNDANKTSKMLLKEAQQEIAHLREKLRLSIESKQESESNLLRMEKELRTMADKANTCESEAQNLSQKIVSIAADLEEERASSLKMAIKVEQLNQELSTTIREAEQNQTARSHNAPTVSQEDLALAAGKFAECQKTISSLGNQLKSLASFEDFLFDNASMPSFFEKECTPSEFGGETWKPNSSEAFACKQSSESSGFPASSASLNVMSGNPGSVINKNGFAKFFCRNKNGIQLEI